MKIKSYQISEFKNLVASSIGKHERIYQAVKT